MLESIVITIGKYLKNRASLGELKKINNLKINKKILRTNILIKIDVNFYYI